MQKTSEHDRQGRNSRRLPSLQGGGFASSHTRLCSTETSAFAAPAHGSFDSIVVTSCWLTHCIYQRQGVLERACGY